MSSTRRRLQFPTSAISSHDNGKKAAHSTPRHSASNGQNDTVLYIFTAVILVLSLILGYTQMPSQSPPGLNRSIFNAHLYTHIQSLWFADVPVGATIGNEASIRKWFYNPNAEER